MSVSAVIAAEPAVRLETWESRFWAKVNKNGPGGCWLWTAAKNGSGYGRFKAPGGLVQAHRQSYEMRHGPIAPSLHVDHLCRVRACVNPDHLEPVTCRENLLRGETVTAQRAAQTHCKRGHEFTAENTYVKPNGCRNCRECGRQSDKAYYARSKRRAGHVR